MPILTKSIKEALLSTFRALFALFQTETGERLLKTWNLRDECNCLLWKAIFSSSSVFSHCLAVVDHRCWWKLKLINVATLASLMFQYNTYSSRESHALVDCDVHSGPSKVLPHWQVHMHGVILCVACWTIGWISRKYAVWQGILACYIALNG